MFKAMYPTVSVNVVQPESFFQLIIVQCIAILNGSDVLF